MDTFETDVQIKEARFIQSEAYLNLSLRRLMKGLAPYVVRRIKGTELFERRREHLIENDVLTPDVLRYLRTMVPTDGDIEKYPNAAKDWETHFGELGKETQNRVDHIIKFRNHHWSHQHGYDDQDVRRFLWQIKMLLDSVYHAQLSAPYMADLVDATADYLNQVHLMWRHLGNLLESAPAPVDSSVHHQSPTISPYRLVPVPHGLGKAEVILNPSALWTPDHVDLAAGLQRVPVFDSSLLYQKGRADALIGQARAAMDREEFDLAVANYEEIKTSHAEGQVDSEHAAALLGRGRLHVISRRYDQAMTDFAAAQELDPALELAPQDAAPYHNMANGKFFGGEYAEATELFTLVLALNPEGSGSYAVKRSTRRSTGGTGSSSGRFTPDRLWEIYHDRGRAYLALGNCESAIKDFNESDRYRSKPHDDNELWRQIAMCSIAIRSNPNSASGHVDRARAYTNAAEYHRALDDLDRAKQLDEDIDCSRECREIFVSRGDDFLEEGQSLQVLEGDDDAGRGNFEQAIECYTQSLRIDAQNASILHTRGIAYFSDGEYGLAFDDYTAALRVSPGCDGNFTDAWGKSYEFDTEQCLFDRGRASALLARTGDRDQELLEQAIQDFQTVLSGELLQGWPGCEDYELLEMGVDVHMELANAHWLRGNVDLAISLYSYVISAVPESVNWPGLWENRGKAFFSNENYAAAISDFNHVIDHIGAPFESAYLLKARGQAHAELGELEQSIADYDAYMEDHSRSREVLSLREIAARLLEEQRPPPETLRNPRGLTVPCVATAPQPATVPGVA